MKRIFILVLAGLAILSCTRKKAGYTVTINCYDADFTSVIMTNQDEDCPVSDTIAVVNNKAVFTGNVDVFDVRYVLAVIEDVQPIFVQRLFLENSDYTITIPNGFSPSIPSELVSDSPIQNKADSVQKLISALFEKTDIKKLQRRYRKGNQAVRDSVMNALEEYNKKVYEIEDKFLAENPLSPIALEQAANNIGNIGLDSARKIVEKFSAVPEFASHRLLRKIKKEVKKKEEQERTDK